MVGKEIEVHKKIEDRVQEIYQKKLEKLEKIRKEESEKGIKVVTAIPNTGTSKQVMGGQDGS